MAATRRDAMQFLAGGAALAAAPAFAQDDAIAKLYKRAIVIDGLSFGHVWDEVEYAAVKASGYAGIVESLERDNLQTAIDELLAWRKRIDENSGKLIMALTAADFERAKSEGKLAVLMNFQDATILERDAGNVEALHALGMRSFQLTYNSRNLLGDGCTERTNAGLSDFGVEVVKRMNKTGVLIDLSHCGRQTTIDGIVFSEKPVAITHTMVEKFRPGHPRAKSDSTLKALAGKGGVVGMCALGYFVGPDPGGATTIETYADHIVHAVNLIGHDHVGVSSDFPVRGLASWATREEWYEPRLKVFKPSYDVKWPPYIPELDGPDRFLRLSHVLSKRGWKAAELEKLLGLNWLRLFREVFGA